uniref:Phosphoribosyl-AMP cyclohydrolase n=1 Tax=Candidatus Kentrum sp. TUN TaxID=2126343 RepID=A0A450ZHY8_9GAMM|nr:MAG: phosphoribosyl-AMP cyclohydrolase [Candidatus Kentron sp. TUN]VFK53370.1 MAG: phosphoribosyl-AMP cyclohydrolase [Candidatus Kentron sp. TUN]VFK62007.1 MAG: phosphoribosyl-AMP cyclohydrolase [Candidatus Kentron sp. TUN]
MDETWLDTIAWNEQGLVPAIAQDAESNDVLMLAWMNRESLALTVQEGRAIYWSRSRQRLWRKGEESGHVQRVLDIRTDCDNDAILLKVEQVGGITCHTGRRRCFFRQLTDGIWQEREPILRDPGEIYGKG